MRRLVAAAAMLLLAGCGGSDRPETRTVVKTTTTETKADVVEDIPTAKGTFNPRAIYEREAPGVVTVLSVFGSGGLGSVLEGNGDGSGLGSGFVLNDQGEIVTNAHVVTQGEGAAIRKAREVFVQFADGNRVEAEIVGYDPNADIALLDIEPGEVKLNPLPLGSSRDVPVGSPVAAMGSPFGEEQSLTVGVVSAVDRDVQSLTKFQIPGAIQTDAAINPGNSGGPLVDAQGRVIGVNQQIKTNSGGGEGVGFAVPIDLVKRSVDQLRETGRVAYAYLGVASQGVYPQLAEEFDLPVERGAWLQDVSPDGPADKAGLRGGGSREQEFQASTWRTGGDIVVRVGDTEVEDPGDVADAIAKLDPGSEVEIELYRDGEKRTVTVRLGERPLDVGDRLGR